MDCTGPAQFAACGRAPYAQLPPEDVALLAADPALRSRYCELAAAVLLPPLRRLSLVLATKWHHTIRIEIIAPARLVSSLPGAAAAAVVRHPGPGHRAQAQPSVAAERARPLERSSPMRRGLRFLAIAGVGRLTIGVSPALPPSRGSPSAPSSGESDVTLPAP